MNNQEIIDFENDEMAYLPFDHAPFADNKLKEVDSKWQNVERQKQDIDKSLYYAQQQLAEYQMLLEQSIINLDWVQTLRIDDEQNLKKIKETYEAKKKELNELEDTYLKHQQELQNTCQILFFMNEFRLQKNRQNLNPQSNVEREDTSVIQLESLQQRQNFLIDSMNLKIQLLTFLKTKLAAQLICQQEETDLNKMNIKESYAERELIIAQKNTIIQGTNKYLFHLKRKQDCLVSYYDILFNNYETVQQMRQELKSTDEEIRIEAENNYNLLIENKKLVRNQQYLIKERDELQDERNKLEELSNQYLIKDQSIKSDNDKTNDVLKKIEEKLNIFQNNALKYYNQKKQYLNELNNQKQQQNQNKITSVNLDVQKNSIILDNIDKQIEQESIYDQIAEAKINKLNKLSLFQIINSRMQEEKVYLPQYFSNLIKYQQLKEKYESTVKTHELQVQQKYDLCQVKYLEVYELNKEHDILRKDAFQPQTYEKIKAQKNQGVVYMRQYIKKQFFKLSQLKQLNSLQEINFEQNKKLTMLEIKKLRIKFDCNKNEKEIKDIQKSQDNIKQKIILFKNQINNNQNLEKKSFKIQFDIDILQKEKDNLLEQIDEQDKQTLFWQKQIEFETLMSDSNNQNNQVKIQVLKNETQQMESINGYQRKRSKSITTQKAYFKKRNIIQTIFQNKVNTKQNSLNLTDKQPNIQQNTFQLKQNSLTSLITELEQVEDAIRKRKVQQAEVNYQFGDIFIK